MESAQYRWHLLGAGSLGCLFAAYLQRAGIAVDLILRNAATLDELHKNGGITLSYNGERTTIPIEATTLDSVSAPIQHLFICTKAQQTSTAIAAIKSKIATDAVIVLLQNGMGVRELLQRELPDAIILHALSTEGAYRSARFHVTHAGHGETLIGTVEPHDQIHAREVVQSLQCELPMSFAPDIERRLWLKLAVNSVINPLSALRRCRNGELLHIDNIEVTVNELCNELAQVAQAEKIDLNADAMQIEVFRVMRATAQNKSSMLQDIEAARTTEIDFINGFIVQRARARNLSCIAHERLLEAIHALHP
ncbi:MAG TPA: 2-dehydropantoate 2-reductase [Spongiibacteraceae bacterium]|nr:2-dehydropantoate 2-reductase [Spongiibacteraceae bacterium]